MRALTIQQPWADAVLTPGGKDVENRGTGFPKGYTGPMLVHAGLRWSDRGQADPRVRDLFDMRTAREWLAARSSSGRYPPTRFCSGAVIGLVEVVDVHTEHGGCCHPWGEAEYHKADGTRQGNVTHLVLEAPRRLAEPIPCPGRLGLWTPNDELLRLVADQLP